MKPRQENAIRTMQKCVVPTPGGLMAAETGSPAPDFTLPNQDREPVTLSKQRGRPTVLAFFPAAFSSACPKELCTFRDALGQLDKLNRAKALVYGISVDTLFSLKAFADQQHLTLPLSSDLNNHARR